MISSSSNLPLGFKQLIKNYFSTRNTPKNSSFPAKSEKSDLSSTSFLIVSDDPFTSFVFGRYIEKWKGEITIASTQAQAIENLCNCQYTMVLLDTKDAELSLSADLLKALGNKKTTAIALVDEKSDALRTLLAKTGLISDWLEKEVEPAELYKKLLLYTR